jgi:hypothetical protein
MEIVGIVDELAAFQLSMGKAQLSLVEGLILVELVAIGCALDICVQVLLRHEKLAVTNHRVLRET